MTPVPFAFILGIATDLGELIMPRPISVTAKVYADTYATRAVVIEILKMMSLANPGTIPAIRASAAHGLVRPEDVSVRDQDVRESIEAILQAAH
jgi:hypothetical protein